MLEELLAPQALTAATEDGLVREAIENALTRSLTPMLGKLNKVLLVPPDFTRFHSNAGLITSLLYEMLSPDCAVDVLPALGTHVRMSQSEWDAMYAPIPFDRMIAHNWRTDVVLLGEVPGSFVEQVSEGLVKDAIPVKGEATPRAVELRFTRHGPVLKATEGRAFAIRTVWSQPGTSAYFGSTGYMQAQDWAGFKQALAG